MKGISIKAILIGKAIDLGGSLILSMLMSTLFAGIYLQQGGDLKQFESYYLHNLPMMLISLALGLSLVVIGGFVTAALSPAAKLLNASIMGALGIITGLIFCRSLPLWYNLASFLLTIPSACLGGYMGTLVKKTEQPPSLS